MMRIALIFVPICLQFACSFPWNDPNAPTNKGEKVYYSSFSTPPKHLDPARNYSAEESIFNEQIYDPLLRYHYLKRPYVLEPNTLIAMPKVAYLTQNLQPVEDKSKAAYSLYEFELKPNIYYQPHPAFARDASENWFYNQQNQASYAHYTKLQDFKQVATQELIAEDYVYQIKRMADPALLSPIRELLSEYIVGMNAFSKQLVALREAQKLGAKEFVDLRKLELAGVKIQGKYRFSILLKGRYPQFKYWLSQVFFSPVPYRVEQFYHLPNLAKNNISLDVYPVGTAAFMLSEHNPNAQIVLTKNPNYRAEFYPQEGEAGDRQRGLLADAGKRLPLIDKAIYRLEKEALPIWSKFLQGYYDRSGISSDSFDQAINVQASGIDLSDELKQRGIYLQKVLLPTLYYFGFNMLDDVLGQVGSKAQQEKNRKLRLAIAIAYNEEEYISIFTNGRGISAQSVLPPGLFGAQQGEAGIDPYRYEWVQDRAQKKPIEYAKQLLAEAGYKDGRNQQTGEPLVLNLDSISVSNGRYPWMQKQFKKLGIELNVRATDYNRFREKMQTGNAQMFESGWGADYPDPENFLFLFYSKNSQVKSGGTGVNATNYANPQYDALFDKMKAMPNHAERFAIVQKMLDILRHDAVIASGYYPYAYALNNQWIRNLKAHAVSRASLKYYNLDERMRRAYQKNWNRPSLLPLFLMLAGLLLLAGLAFMMYRQRQSQRIVED